MNFPPSLSRLVLILSAAAAFVLILSPPRRPDTFRDDPGQDDSILAAFRNCSGSGSCRVVDLPSGLAGIPILLEQVRGRAVVPSRAVAQLTRLGPDAGLALIPALDDRDDGVRDVAVRTISVLGVRLRAHGTEILPPLLRRLRDPISSVRCAATLALYGLPVSSEPAIRALIDELQSNDSLPRSDAICLKSASAHVLGKIGPEAIAAVPALLVTLQDGYEEIHGVAAIALWRITYDTNAILPILCTKLSGPDESARSLAALTLEKIQGETPLPPCLVYEMQAACR